MQNNVNYTCLLLYEWNYPQRQTIIYNNDRWRSGIYLLLWSLVLELMKFAMFFLIASPKASLEISFPRASIDCAAEPCRTSLYWPWSRKFISGTSSTQGTKLEQGELSTDTADILKLTRGRGRVGDMMK